MRRFITAIWFGNGSLNHSLANQIPDLSLPSTLLGRFNDDWVYERIFVARTRQLTDSTMKPLDATKILTQNCRLLVVKILCSVLHLQINCLDWSFIEAIKKHPGQLHLSFVLAARARRDTRPQTRLNF